MCVTWTPGSSLKILCERDCSLSLTHCALAPHRDTHKQICVAVVVQPIPIVETSTWGLPLACVELTILERTEKMSFKVRGRTMKNIFRMPPIRIFCTPCSLHGSETVDVNTIGPYLLFSKTYWVGLAQKKTKWPSNMSIFTSDYL